MSLPFTKKETVNFHQFDEDGICYHCNFDGAEWHWWKHSTYEGRANTEAKMPSCINRPASTTIEEDYHD